MAEVVLFHHVHGLTDGVRGFAEDLRAAGHIVHTPDLFEGRVFDTIEEGMAYADAIPFEEMIVRPTTAVEGLPAALVYGGYSMGVMCAQKLATSRPGAVGGLLFHSAVDPRSGWARGRPAHRPRSTPPTPRRRRC